MNDTPTTQPLRRAERLYGAPWVAVPVGLLSAVSDPALATYAAVAAHANARTGSAWPGVPLLAVERGCSQRAVQRHLRELERAGWLATTSTRRPDGSQGTNTYRLVHPQPVDEPVDDEPDEAEGVTDMSPGG